MTKPHAKLSPSASERWINCPGSVKAIDDALEAKAITIAPPSFFANEGTLAHELAEKALTDNRSCFHYEGMRLEYENAIEVDREMCSYVQSYVDFVRIFDGDLRVEQRVSFTDWVPDGYGTADAVIVQRDRIVCIDLKYGRGVPVQAEGNTQALCYALGAYQSLKKVERENIKSVLIVVHQPRLDSVSEWEISIDELLRHGERIAQAAELALSDDAPLVAGESQCRWCPVSPICKEQMRVMQEVIGKDFDDLTKQTPVNLLDDAELSKVLNAKAQIVAWLSAVEDHVVSRLNSGDSFPGFKLVAGRSLRQWSDEELAQDVLTLALGEEAFTKKLLSPSQAEKALGKKSAKNIQDLIVKPDGKPTLVPESDPRESINISVDDF